MDYGEESVHVHDNQVIPPSNIRSIGTQDEALCVRQQVISHIDTQDDPFCVRQEDIRNIDTQDEALCVRQEDIRNIDTHDKALYLRQQVISNSDTQDEPLDQRQQGIRNSAIHSESSSVRQNDMIETEPQDEVSSASQQVSFSDKLVINLDELIENTDHIFRQKSRQQPLSRRRCRTADVLSTDDGYEASMEDLERETLSDSENPRLSMSPVSGDLTPQSKGGNFEPATESEFRYSLLEEVLMQKKLALLKSVEVKQFLQSQQAQVLAAVSTTSPKNSGSQSAVYDSSVMDNG